MFIKNFRKTKYMYYSLSFSWGTVKVDKITNTDVSVSDTESVPNFMYTAY